MSRLLVVDDHRLLAESLVHTLRALGHEVARAPDIRPVHVLEEVGRFRPHLVLLDLDLAGANGADLVGPIRETGAEVVVVTGLDDRSRWGETIEAGAMGVLSKHRSFDELVEAIGKAVDHLPVNSQPERCDLLLDLHRRRARSVRGSTLLARLTPRERQVLADLCEGHTARTIARTAVVSMSTVRSQIRSVLCKLGVHSQLEAVALARELGWTPVLLRDPAS